MAPDVDDDRSDDDGTKPLDYLAGAGTADDPVHQQALERLQVAADAYNEQLTREKNALRYQVPDLMWSDDARDLRAGDTIGDITIPNRPTVAIPKVEQAVRLVLNQERAAHLGVKFEPVDERGDDKSAEKLTGVYRSIERESRAGLARSWAFNRAVKAGRGAWRIVTVPAYNYRQTGDQDIRIKRILYQDAVYLDPFAVEPDWSDAEWGFVLEWVSWTKYKRLYKRKKGPAKDDGSDPGDIPSMLAAFSDGELTKLQDSCPAWIRGDGEARGVLTGEYMFMESRPEVTIPTQKWKEGEERRVQWRQMNAVEFMDRGVVHSAHVPIVPAIGDELIPFEDERRWVGMYEPNMGAQDMLNYSASTAIESLAQEPRNTWVMAEGQEKGHERELLLANVRNFPYVRYNPMAVEGTMVPPPHREQADMSKLAMSVEVLRMAGDFIHAGTSMYEPSLGDHSPNVRTKGGTLALQQQGDTANSHWLDNLAELSMTLEAKIIASMVPYYYDRVGRVVRALGQEDTDAKRVMLNQPFRMQGKNPVGLPFETPDQQNLARAAAADENQPDIEMINLRDGRYMPAVSVGKGYRTRVQQGADELGQLFQAEPELFKLLGDIYLRFRDFPGHDEAAERMKKLLPPGLQGDDAKQDPRVQLEQAQGMIQQLQAALKELEPEKLKYQAQVQIQGLKEQTAKLNRWVDVQLQAMKGATTIEAAKIKAGVDQALLGAAAEDEAIALGRQLASDHAEGELDRQHEREGRAHEAAMGAAAAQSTASGAEAEHGRALEQGEAEHAQTLEQGEQAADQAAAAGEQEHAQTLEQQAAAAAAADDGSAGGAD